MGIDVAEEVLSQEALGLLVDELLIVTDGSPLCLSPATLSAEVPSG